MTTPTVDLSIVATQTQTVSGTDLIGRIDFTKGFQSFYVEWPISNCDKSIVSPDFVTEISTPEGRESFSWRLEITKTEGTWFGIRLNKRLSAIERSLAVIRRLSLSSTEKKAFFDNCFLEVFKPGGGWGQAFSPFDAESFVGNNMVFRCWIDVPKAIAAPSFDQSGNSFQKTSSDIFLFDKSKIAQGVEDEDVTLAILKKSLFNRFCPFVADRRLFRCGRNVLSARSPVFERMFANRQWKENGSLVEIDDVDEKTMKIVLNFVFTGRLPDQSIKHRRILNLVYAADKYDFDVLKNYCVSILMSRHQSLEKRLQQWKLADRHNLDQLKAVCLAQLQLTTKLDYFVAKKSIEKVSSDLFDKIVEAVGNRQQDTTDIAL